MGETLFIGQTVHLQGMSVFDIGSNKPHINFGLMSSQISSLSSSLKSLNSKIKNIAVPGFVLELIKENDEELLLSLQSLVKKNNLNILSVPFYNSSISLLSKEEFSEQLSLQEEITKEVFGKSSIGFLCSQGVLPVTIESVLNEKHSTVFYCGNSLCLSIKKPSYTLKETTIETIGESVSSPLTEANSSMETHLMTELKDMYSHIISMGDADTLTSWRLMSQPSMIIRANVSTFKNDAYEHYMQMMNTLNDIAHNINAVKLAKKGLFQEKPLINASPSQFLSQI